MKSSHNKSLGDFGESLAADYLEAHGYTILSKNVHTPYGEIDLIAKFAGVIIFVEIKTRKSTIYGPPEQSITPKKAEHMKS